MEEHIDKKTKNNLAMPIAVVIAGALIAGAVIYSNDKNSKIGFENVPQGLPQEQSNGDLEKINPISSEDHIRGNPEAPVKIVEYSDTECPFCKKFHTTMKQVITEDGNKGNVAWVYRHFPLDELHPKARKEAEATECAEELGGNDKFWEYLDRLMEVTPANNGLDPAELPRIAEYVGLDKNKFTMCLISGKYAQKVEEHVQNALATGGQGTPWSIVINAKGNKYPLSGAQPYAAVKQLIELTLKGK